MLLVTVASGSGDLAQPTANPAANFPQDPAPNSAQQAANAPLSDTELLAALTRNFDKLAPQTIHPAESVLTRPYLTPAGFYQEMWDWDGFFIGAHWANQDAADAGYLRDWVLSFTAAADADGYVAGCIAPSGPRQLFGKFAVKPFLAQGALLAADKLHDDSWLRGAWPAIERIEAYRRRTQFDAHWKLWFWDNGLQSGADNSASLTNDPSDRSAILAVDASVFAMREDEAMAVLARRLGFAAEAARYQRESVETPRDPGQPVELRRGSLSQPAPRYGRLGAPAELVELCATG
jgi:alpha,alpha-trehalase